MSVVLHTASHCQGGLSLLASSFGISLCPETPWTKGVDATGHQAQCTGPRTEECFSLCCMVGAGGYRTPGDKRRGQGAAVLALHTCKGRHRIMSRQLPAQGRESTSACSMGQFPPPSTAPAQWILFQSNFTFKGKLNSRHGTPHTLVDIWWLSGHCLCSVHTIARP